MFNLLYTILSNSQLLALAFLGASLIKIYKKEWENAVPRLAVFAWYTFLWLDPQRFSVEEIRVVGRWLFVLLASIEIWFFLIRWGVKKYLKPLEKINHV